MHTLVYLIGNTQVYMLLAAHNQLYYRISIWWVKWFMILAMVVMHVCILQTGSGLYAQFAC